MFRQVCIIEPSFFNATSKMHRRPIDGQHLVLYVILVLRFVIQINDPYMTYLISLKNLIK